MTDNYLSDCVFQNPDITELFMVTSTKAYDIAMRDRNRQTQAILLISPDFCLSDDLYEVLDNETFKATVSALGSGILLPGNNTLYYPKGLRYGKVVVVSEPVVRREILRLFLTYLPNVLSGGRLFVPEKPFDSDSNDFVESTINHATRQLIAVAQTEVE